MRPRRWCEPCGLYMYISFGGEREAVRVAFAFADVGYAAAGGRARVRDVFSRGDVGVFVRRFVAPAVPAHDAVLLRLRPPEAARR